MPWCGMEKGQVGGKGSAYAQHLIHLCCTQQRGHGEIQHLLRNVSLKQGPLPPPPTTASEAGLSLPGRSPQRGAQPTLPDADPPVCCPRTAALAEAMEAFRVPCATPSSARLPTRHLEEAGPANARPRPYPKSLARLNPCTAPEATLAAAAKTKGLGVRSEPVTRDAGRPCPESSWTPRRPREAQPSPPKPAKGTGGPARSASTSLGRAYLRGGSSALLVDQELLRLRPRRRPQRPRPAQGRGRARTPWTLCGRGRSRASVTSTRPSWILTLQHKS